MNVLNNLLLQDQAIPLLFNDCLAMLIYKWLQDMCQFGRRALPVTDQQGKVQGLITVFNIFKALLKNKPGTSTAGKTSRKSPSAQT